LGDAQYSVSSTCFVKSQAIVGVSKTPQKYA
jgi:hypothetical protein